MERFDRFYVEDQYGGFAGWHADRATALVQGRKYVAEHPGDTFDPDDVDDVDDADGPSWLELDRATFDVEAPAPTLFAAEPTMAAPPDDGCGTGDLLALI